MGKLLVVLGQRRVLLAKLQDAHRRQVKVHSIQEAEALADRATDVKGPGQTPGRGTPERVERARRN